MPGMWVTGEFIDKFFNRPGDYPSTLRGAADAVLAERQNFDARPY